MLFDDDAMQPPAVDAGPVSAVEALYFSEKGECCEKTETKTETENRPGGAKTKYEKWTQRKKGSDAGRVEDAMRCDQEAAAGFGAPLTRPPTAPLSAEAARSLTSCAAFTSASVTRPAAEDADAVEAAAFDAVSCSRNGLNTASRSRKSLCTTLTR